MKRSMFVLMVILSILALTGTAALAVGDLRGGPWPQSIEPGRLSY